MNEMKAEKHLKYAKQAPNRNNTIEKMDQDVKRADAIGMISNPIRRFGDNLNLEEANQ